MSNEITLKSENALAEVPFNIEDMAADADLGGKVSLKDIAIPYLYVLQSNSPQTNADHSKYITGAASGMWYLTNLELTFDGREKGLEFIPCYFESLVTEWTPREQGGGLIASHDPGAPILNSAKPNERGQLFLPNGHQLIDTAYHYILVKRPDNDAWTQAIMPMKSTALKVSRRMNSTIATTMIPGTSKQAPRWLHKWHALTIRETKDQYVFSAPKFAQLGMVTANEYNAAKQYALIASKGLLRRVALESAAEETVDNRPSDDNIPF
jgi:hypothetical protein